MSCMLVSTGAFLVYKMLPWTELEPEVSSPLVLTVSESLLKNMCCRFEAAGASSACAFLAWAAHLGKGFWATDISWQSSGISPSSLEHSSSLLSDKRKIWYSAKFTHFCTLHYGFQLTSSLLSHSNRQMSHTSLKCSGKFTQSYVHKNWLLGYL